MFSILISGWKVFSSEYTKIAQRHLLIAAAQLRFSQHLMVCLLLLLLSGTLI